MKPSILLRGAALLTVLGSAILFSLSSVQAQNRGQIISESPAERQDFAAERQAFTNLKNRLYACILAVQPRANISNDAGLEFHASYRNLEYPKHAVDNYGRLSVDSQGSFPDDFDELSLTVSISQDDMHYRTPKTQPLVQAERAQPFGATYEKQYNLGFLRREISGDYPDVPTGNIHYRFLQALLDAGIIEGSSGTYSWSLNLTRYQFAVAVARIADRLQLKNGSQTTKRLSIVDAYSQAKARYSPEIAATFLALAIEFSDELAKFGIGTDYLGMEKPVVDGHTWRPRYKYLNVEFSYGKGLDEKVVAEIKRAIADYAVQLQPSPSVDKERVRP